MHTDDVQMLTDAIDSTEGLPIRYNLFYPEGQAISELPVLLFLHGFKGFKDWGTFPAIGRQLSGQGFVVLAMNFSLNGVGENPLAFDRLDLFARETLSQDLDDIGSVLRGMHREEVTADGTSLNVRTVGVIGHSRGGQTAVAAAAEYPEIKCLVSWSAVADYNARWSDDMKADWEQEGVTEIINGRTGQVMPMKKIVYDDARENADRVIALHRARELDRPALFVHARGDEAVPYENAEQLYEACSSEAKELMLIDDSGHTFGGSHPFEGDQLPDALQKVVDRSSEWLHRHIK